MQEILNTIEEIQTIMNDEFHCDEFIEFKNKLEKIKYNVINKRNLKKTNMVKLFNEHKNIKLAEIKKLANRSCDAQIYDLWNGMFKISKIYTPLAKLTTLLYNYHFKV